MYSDTLVRIDELPVLMYGCCIALADFVMSRPPGEMASRLTTNQEIAGSIPAVVKFSLFWFLSLFSNSPFDAEARRRC